MSKSTKETKVDTKKRKDPPKDDDSKNSSKEKKQKTKKKEEEDKKCQHKFKIKSDDGSDGVTVYVCTKCEVYKNGVFNNDLANNHGHLFDELELEQDVGIPTWMCATCGCLDDEEEESTGRCKRHTWIAYCKHCDSALEDQNLDQKTILSYIAFLENELENAKILAGIYADMCECKSRSMTFARGPPHSDTRCGTCLKEVQQSQFLSSGIRVTQINADTGGTAVAVGGSSVVRLSR